MLTIKSLLSQYTIRSTDATSRFVSITKELRNFKGFKPKKKKKEAEELAKITENALNFSKQSDLMHN